MVHPEPQQLPSFQNFQQFQYQYPPQQQQPFQPQLGFVVNPNIATANNAGVAVQQHEERNVNKKRVASPQSTKSFNKNEQVDCCLNVCNNAVTNRLRFSLRCVQESDFKADYIERGWNRVCHYHYFNDLYKYKKFTKKEKQKKEMEAAKAVNTSSMEDEVMADRTTVQPTRTPSPSTLQPSVILPPMQALQFPSHQQPIINNSSNTSNGFTYMNNAPAFSNMMNIDEDETTSMINAKKKLVRSQLEQQGISLDNKNVYLQQYQQFQQQQQPQPPYQYPQQQQQQQYPSMGTNPFVQRSSAAISINGASNGANGRTYSSSLERDAHVFLDFVTKAEKKYESLAGF